MRILGWLFGWTRRGATTDREPSLEAPNPAEIDPRGGSARSEKSETEEALERAAKRERQ